MNVVVGVDGSPPSRTALRLAAQEARCRQVPLIAVSAYEPPLGKPAGQPMLPGTVSQYVLHKAECPVMLMPGSSSPPQPADQPKGDVPR